VSGLPSAVVSASLVPLYIVVGLVLLVLLLAIFVWLGDGRYARALLARERRESRPCAGP
jgi:hypothetical protein